MALVDKKLTELTEILSVPDNAFIHVVDPNDVSQSPQGSSYKAKKSTIGGAVKAQVTVSGTVKTNINNADPIVYLKGSVDALLADKQDTLVNGINIASINSQNLLNGGNIEIETNISLLVTNDATTNRVLSILDANTFIVFSGGNTNLTIPLNANVGFEIGTKIEAFINGVLRLNVLATSGVTIISPNGLIAINQSTLLLTKIAINTWYVNIIPKLFLIANGGLNYSAQLQNLNANYLIPFVLECANLFGDGGGITAIRAIIGGGVNNRWESNVRLRLAAGLTPVNAQDLTPKSYVDAIPNPTLNVLPKKGASGFVDSAISEDATNVLSAKVLRLAAGLTAVNEQDLTTLGQVNTALNLKNALISHLEFNNTDLTVWNNGKGNISSNTSFGDGALLSNTTGGNNTANGVSALRLNTTGSNNTSNGLSALLLNTTGGFNTANGVSALQSNTTGVRNTANGVSALFSNTTGINNVASGLNSGRFISDGLTANTNSDRCLFLGNETKALADNQSNQIVIGDSAIGAGSNTATLGNTSITKTVLRGNVETNGLLKLGQFTTATEPAYFKGASFFNTTLNKSKIGGETIYETQITGTGTTNKLAKFTDSGAVVNSIITELANGNVGFGVNNPLTGIHIEGNGNNATFTMRDLAITNALSNSFRIFAASQNKYAFGVGSVTSFPNNIVIDGFNKFIGLNTTTPTEVLDVLGSIKISNLLKLGQFTTATEPAYVKGASFFNTTLNKMRIGGETAYETVTSS
jgi:hypothetical protein